MDIDKKLREMVQEGLVEEARQFINEEIDAGRGDSIKVWIKLLEPPVVRTVPRSNSAGDYLKNRQWVLLNGNEYKGQWIALHDGNFLGSHQTLKYLVEKVRSTYPGLIFYIEKV